MDLGQLEFAITRHLEGDLSDEESRALDEILRTDERARLMLTDHWKLTALLRSWPVPELGWEELSADISAMVTGKIAPHVAAEDQKLQRLFTHLAPLPAVRWDRLAAQLTAAVQNEMESVGAEDEALTAALRAAPVPAVNWNALAKQISNHIDSAEGEAEARLDEMLRSELAPEVNWDQLSQQIQGKIQVLEAHEDARLDALLKSEAMPAVNFERLSQHISAEVAAVDAQLDGHLDATLRSSPVPAVKWDALAAHISQSVAQAADEQAAAASAQRETMRIGWGSKWMRNVTRLAIAAVVALAAAVGIRTYLGHGPDDQITTPIGKPTAVAVVEGPQREEATGTAVVDVQIGPAPSYADAHRMSDELDPADSAPVVFALPVRSYEDNSPGIFE